MAINIPEILKGLDAHPLHPMLVHFPIALFVAAMVFELLHLIFKKKSLHDSALAVYIGAVVATPITVLAGLAEEKKLNIHHPVMEAHEQLGLATMWVALASLLTLAVLYFKRVRYPAWIFFLLTVLMAVLVCLAAFFGGEMVYEYGVGVESP